MRLFGVSRPVFGVLRCYPVLLLAVAIYFFSPFAAKASGIWRRLGRFNNGVYFTDIYSRLLRGSHSLSEGRHITFQINLVGHSVGAMEFDYSCSPNSLHDFLFERVIPIPTDGSRRFDTYATRKFQEYKKIAATYYCDNFSSLLVPYPVDEQWGFGKQLYSPRLESKGVNEDSQFFAPQDLATCLGTRAMKDLIDGYPAKFCNEIYKSKGWLSY